MKLHRGGIADLIIVVKGDIVNKARLDELKIDTIVNAAKPTLMGSDQGVDGAIHKFIDEEKYDGFLNKQICKELKGEEEQLVLCKRGHAVTTSGLPLCERIIHAVGIPYDGDIEKGIECSSSRAHILESCYYSIVEQIRSHSDMRNVAIPIIGSGEYGFPFETAVEIAIASVGNALVEWYQQDPEMFEMANLKQIYFFIYDKRDEECLKKCQKAQKILEKYQNVFKNTKKVVFQSSWTAHKRYRQELKKYDELRGYFSLVKRIREYLLVFRSLFFPFMWIKDMVAGNNWEKRRKTVELLAACKLILPVLFYGICKINLLEASICIVEGICFFIICYCMLDTITYLLTLILLADIQRPSANIIRSMILLFFNYIEVSLDMAYLYYIYSGKVILFRKAVQLGFFGVEVSDQIEGLIDHAFLYANEGIRFFFITIIFGYFAGSMKQRRFKS